MEIFSLQTELQRTKLPLAKDPLPMYDVNPTIFYCNTFRRHCGYAIRTRSLT